MKIDEPFSRQPRTELRSGRIGGWPNGRMVKWVPKQEIFAILEYCNIAILQYCNMGVDGPDGVGNSARCDRCSASRVSVRNPQGDMNDSTRLDSTRIDAAPCSGPHATGPRHRPSSPSIGIFVACLPRLVGSPRPPVCSARPDGKRQFRHGHAGRADGRGVGWWV